MKHDEPDPSDPTSPFCSVLEGRNPNSPTNFTFSPSEVAPPQSGTYSPSEPAPSPKGPPQEHLPSSDVFEVPTSEELPNNPPGSPVSYLEVLPDPVA